MSFVAYWVALDIACPQHVPKNGVIANLKKAHPTTFFNEL
jgi:hypothetical protein